MRSLVTAQNPGVRLRTAMRPYVRSVPVQALVLLAAMWEAGGSMAPDIVSCNAALKACGAACQVAATLQVALLLQPLMLCASINCHPHSTLPRHSTASRTFQVIQEHLSAVYAMFHMVEARCRCSRRWRSMACSQALQRTARSSPPPLPLATWTPCSWWGVILETWS